MNRTNRSWLPSYCDPEALLPKIPETRALFRRRPYLVEDFIGKTISFLESDEAKKLGLEFDYRRAVPCRWKCSDESLFGVDLAIYAHTKAYPFDKGKIGGYFNAPSIGAAVHHGSINVDIGGSHVGYVPGPGGGSFGKIWRPSTREVSSNCGHLIAVIAPFERVYRDACNNILIMRPEGGRPMVSVPNEYVQPTWSTERVKLLVDLDRFTDGEVEYEQDLAYTHTQIGRSLFFVHQRFLDDLGPEGGRELCTPRPKRIDRHLTHPFFNIWDSETELQDGRPTQRLLPYMKRILAARNSPVGLKVAVVNTALEHNRLTDAVRVNQYREYDFVSFSGVFIDQYSEEHHSYVNLFLPMGMSIKPRGRTREREFSPDQIHEILQRMPLAKPRMPLKEVFGYERPESVLESFTFEPGLFKHD
jgi:hypothetical protein